MKSLLLFQNFGAGEIIIIALVILLLFGGKKIPELMRGLGKGVRSFKEGINDIEQDITKIDDKKKHGDNNWCQQRILRTKVLRCPSGTIWMFSVRPFSV